MYYSFGVSITMSKVNELPATFPAITLCNVNPFNEAHSKVLQYIEEKMKLEDCLKNSSPLDFENCFNLKYAFQDSFNNAFDKFLDKLKRIVASDTNITAEFRASLGYFLDRDMLVSCHYNGEVCSETNGSFYRYWNNNYGNCYSFNLGIQPASLLQTSSTGQHSGLELELVVSKCYFDLLK